MGKIMIAEDDPDIVESIKLILEMNDYEVVSVMDDMNLEWVVKEKPDLLFLDIWMEDVDGSDVCRQIKDHDATKHVPVVMLSANRDVKAIASECGADGYIEKPFELEDLLKVTEEFTN